MGKKSLRAKRPRGVESGSVGSPLAESPSYISINKDDRSPPSVSNSGNSNSRPPPPRSVSYSSPRFFGTRPTHHSKKSRTSSNPAVRVRSSDRVPMSPSIPVSKYGNLYSLGSRRATLGDLEQIRTKYNIPPSVQLRVPCVDERPECLLSDEIARHIDLFDLGVCLLLQPFYMRMFSYLRVAPRQLSLLGWRTLPGMQILWLQVLGVRFLFEN